MESILNFDDPVATESGAFLQVFFGRRLQDAGAAAVHLEVTNVRNHRPIFSDALILLSTPLINVSPKNTYVVHIALPSGESITRQVQSGAEGEITRVSLETKDQSPREYLSATYALHGLPSRPPSGQGQTEENATAASASGLPPEALLNIWWSIASDVVNPRNRNGSLVNRQSWYSMPPYALGQAIDQDETFASDPRILRSLRLRPELIDYYPIEYWLSSYIEIGNLWVQTTDPNGRSRFTAIPKSTEIRLVITRSEVTTYPDANSSSSTSAPPSTKTHVILDGGTPYAEALLGYLSSGNIAAMRKTCAAFINESIDGRFGPREGTEYGGVVFGLALLRACGDEILAKAAPLFAKISAFDRFSDASVVSAWYALVRPGNTEAESQFRQLLLQSTRLGLPVFTEALRLLHDGLRLLDRRSRGEDNEVAQALETIRPYTVVADPQAVNTTLYMSNPNAY